MGFAFYWRRLTINKCNVIPGSCKCNEKKNTQKKKIEDFRELLF